MHYIFPPRRKQHRLIWLARLTNIEFPRQKFPKKGFPHNFPESFYHFQSVWENVNFLNRLMIVSTHMNLSTWSSTSPFPYWNSLGRCHVHRFVNRHRIHSMMAPLTPHSTQLITNTPPKVCFRYNNLSDLSNITCSEPKYTWSHPGFICYLG